MSDTNINQDIGQQLLSYCKDDIFSQDKQSDLYGIRLGAYELFKKHGLPTSKNENGKSSSQ